LIENARDRDLVPNAERRQIDQVAAAPIDDERDPLRCAPAPPASPIPASSAKPTILKLLV